MATTSSRPGPASGAERTGSAGPIPQPGEARAQVPIQWPHPDRSTLTLIGIWVVGLLVALAVPAAIVPPNDVAPDLGRVWLAFTFTALGAVVMLVSAGILFRRSREYLVLIMGVVPAVSVIVGGIILAATKSFPNTNGYPG